MKRSFDRQFRPGSRTLAGPKDLRSGRNSAVQKFRDSGVNRVLVHAVRSRLHDGAHWPGDPESLALFHFVGL